uniref:hypothetical protein n=1 Tax=Cephaloticoccus sp. TaxID=1985742 RepID=UPI004048F536
MTSLPRVLLALTTLAACAFAGHASPERSSMLSSLTAANDALVEEALSATDMNLSARGLGEQVMIFSAAFTNQLSQHHHDEHLIDAMDQRIASLLRSQRDDGLFDMGNLDSPPDSAFVLKTLARAQLFLVNDATTVTEPTRLKLKGLILKTAEGVRLGGVHTPNHRWAICSALAQVNQLYPNSAYIERIDEWLAEGLDVNADGEWSEHSPSYNAHVNNPSILEVSVLLNRPSLLDAIRRNLEMSLYYIEADGELETVASRRQDQDPALRIYLWEYYVPFRYLAAHDQNPRFAAVARRIERDFLTELGEDARNMSSALVSMLEFPAMRQAIPADAPLPRNYAKVFESSGLARIRRDNITATIFGGNDWHLGLGVGSGLATNPTFFKFRKGTAVLDSIRLSPMFFNIGFFYPQSLKVLGENQYELTQTVSVPYHLPLPPEKRSPDGNYPLTPDGRIFFKLDFPVRKQELKTLTTKVIVREDNGTFELDFDVQGLTGVPIVLELCFRKEGVLSGVESLPAGVSTAKPSVDSARQTNADFILKDGQGTYTVGDDKITFGPGSFTPTRIRMEGLEYANYNGQNRVDGYRVYITGVTPFRHTLTLK